MSRATAILVALWLSACGLDGPPTRPEPDPAPQAPQSGVVIGGSGYLGGSVRR